jgi:anti-anti-sigma regulatory factor
MAAEPIYDGDILRISRTDDPPTLYLGGEVDATGYDALADALSAMVADHREIRLDFTDLAFIDLGGLHVLGRHTGARRVVLENLPADLRHFIDTLGWDRLPGLTPAQKEGDPS